MEEDPANREEEGSEDEWEQVGPRNKTSITRQADFVRTPITDIFGGHIRYVGWAPPPRVQNKDDPNKVIIAS